MDQDSQMRLANKVALVTGASQGIGAAIALALARQGADVAISSRNRESLEIVAKKIRDMKRQVLVAQADVSVSTEVNAMVKTVIDKFSHIDILVNNAGIYETVPFDEMTEAQWDRIMAVNLKGTFNCSKAVIPFMKKQKSGKIVNIASDAGKTGGAIPVAHYAASKAAIISLTKSLARELAPYTMNVNSVSPGIIETDMSKAVLKKRNVSVPLGRLGTPEDVANAVVFLVSDEAAYITGEILDVNGGLVMD